MKWFTNKFLTVPPSNSTISELPLPSGNQSLNEFLSSEKANVFKEKVLEIIKFLQTWAETNGINSKEFSKLQAHFDNAAEDGEISFMLCKEGLPKLYHIKEALTSESVPMLVKQMAIRDLLSNLDACAPAVYTHICNCHLKLTINSALEFQGIRRQFSEQVALEALERTISQLNRRPLFYENNEIHYVNAILNAMYKILGIDIIEDPYQPHVDYFINYAIQEFHKQIIDCFTPAVFIDALLSNLNIDEIKNHMAANAKEEIGIDLSPTNIKYLICFLEKKLDKYGPDPYFHLNDLMDQDKLAEGEYQIVEDANNILFLSLFERLKNSSDFSNECIAGSSVALTLNDGATVNLFQSDSRFNHVIKNSRRYLIKEYLEEATTLCMNPPLHMMSTIEYLPRIFKQVVGWSLTSLKKVLMILPEEKRLDFIESLPKEEFKAMIKSSNELKSICFILTSTEGKMAFRKYFLSLLTDEEAQNFTKQDPFMSSLFSARNKRSFEKSFESNPGSEKPLKRTQNGC